MTHPGERSLLDAGFASQGYLAQAGLPAPSALNA